MSTHNEQRIGLNRGKGLKEPPPPKPTTEISQMVEQIMPGREGQTEVQIIVMRPMGIMPSPHLPDDSEMEREEGGDSQLLHTPTSNNGMLATFIQPGRGSLHNNNSMEGRKKIYPTTEERLQQAPFYAQKMLNVTHPHEKTKQTNQNSGNSVR